MFFSYLMSQTCLSPVSLFLHMLVSFGWLMFLCEYTRRAWCLHFYLPVTPPGLWATQLLKFCKFNDITFQYTPNSCFSWAMFLPPPLSITVEAQKCLYSICLVLSTLKGWSRFNFLLVIGPFPLLFHSCCSCLLFTHVWVNFWVLEVLWKCFAVACGVHWYLWKYLQTETTLNFSVNLCFQFRIWNWIFFSWKDPQVLFLLRYLRQVMCYTGSNETGIFILLLWWVFVICFLCTFFPQCVTSGYAGNQAKFSWLCCLALLAEVVTPRFVGRLICPSIWDCIGWSFRGGNIPDQAFWCFRHSGNARGGTQWDLLVCSYQNAAVI